MYLALSGISFSLAVVKSLAPPPLLTLTICVIFYGILQCIFFEDSSVIAIIRYDKRNQEKMNKGEKAGLSTEVAN